MVANAMAGDRLIGMALLRGDWEKDYYGNPDIYPTGCLGEIVRMTPFPDGRSNIVLYGLREYEILEHILDRTPYRQAKVRLREEAAGAKANLPNSTRKEVVGLMQQLTKEKESDIQRALADPALEDETWLNLCCFFLDLPILEKQSLLQAKSPEERAAGLVNILRFRVAERDVGFESLQESRGKKAPH